MQRPPGSPLFPNFQSRTKNTRMFSTSLSVATRLSSLLSVFSTFCLRAKDSAPLHHSVYADESDAVAKTAMGWTRTNQTMGSYENSSGQIGRAIIISSSSSDSVHLRDPIQLKMVMLKNNQRHNLPEDRARGELAGTRASDWRWRWAT